MEIRWYVTYSLIRTWKWTFDNELFHHEDETLVMYVDSDTKVFSYIKWWVSLLFLLFFTSSCRSSSGKPILSTYVLLQTESNCPWLVLWIMKRVTAKKHYFVTVKPKKLLPVRLAFFHIYFFHKVLRMKNHKGNLAPLISAAAALKSFGVVS